MNARANEIDVRGQIAREFDLELRANAAGRHGDARRGGRVDAATGIAACVVRRAADRAACCGAQEARDGSAEFCLDR